MSLLLQAAAADLAAKPLDVVALVQVTFTGLALLVSAIGGVYAAVAANRAKRAEEASKANSTNIDKVQDNVKLIERNTNSMTSEIARLARKEGSVEGERKGVAAGQETARVFAEGQRQGAENERASAQANASAGGPISPAVEPVAVKDEVTAAAVKRVGDVIEAASEATKKP